MIFRHFFLAFVYHPSTYANTISPAFDWAARVEKFVKCDPILSYRNMAEFDTFPHLDRGECRGSEDGGLPD